MRPPLPTLSFLLEEAAVLAVASSLLVPYLGLILENAFLVNAHILLV